MHARDILPFFRAWVAEPFRVAAPAPSGRSLARAITAEITPASAPVIELGPGTGVFTRELIRRGVPEDRLVLIEYGADFARLVQERFPRANVLAMDAAGLRKLALFGPGQVGAVVSGLPLLSMSPKKVMQILGGAFEHLRPGAAFFQFTYAMRCPIPQAILERLGLKETRRGSAFANVPPARVYRIERQ